MSDLLFELKSVVDWIASNPVILLLLVPEMMVVVTFFQRPRTALWVAIVALLMSTGGWYGVWKVREFAEGPQALATPGQVMAWLIGLVILIFGGFLLSIGSGLVMLMVRDEKRHQRERFEEALLRERLANDAWW